MLTLLKSVFFIVLFLGGNQGVKGIDRPLQFFPLNGFQPKDIGILINEADPVSVLIGLYYQRRRNIPAQNIIPIRFPPGGASLSPVLFKEIKQSLDKQTPAHIQAYALTWTSPFKVGCMSITTAFAAGYNSSFCAKDCSPTRLNPYYKSISDNPFDDFGWRPTMMLAGKNYQEVVRLIERGIRSDSTFPGGAGYLIRTPDIARSIRAYKFEEIKNNYNGLWPIEVINTWTIENRKNILFYFTGLERVPGLTTNRFVPGAIADHLTSKGGQLTGSRQMSSLRWLEAGATGSYGAVLEPCNFPEKFPDPELVIMNYIRGNTLIEAYWKSVAWPGQGVFIGEPLARPFGFDSSSMHP